MGQRLASSHFNYSPLDFHVKQPKLTSPYCSVSLFLFLRNLCATAYIVTVNIFQEPIMIRTAQIWTASSVVNNGIINGNRIAF